ncbi:hypothetical protein PspLS_04691 [Pyricularia sp. CBS 133598]|nr:hypothetical protein PspLS_04691 [Pyricularia sp. CBS 133598]
MKFSASLLLTFLATAAIAAPATDDIPVFLQARNSLDGRPCSFGSAFCKGGMCIIKDKPSKDTKCEEEHELGGKN